MGLKSNGDELRVDAAQRGVPGVAGDADVVERILALERGAEDMAKLGLSNNANGHDRCLRKSGRNPAQMKAQIQMEEISTRK